MSNWNYKSSSFSSFSSSSSYSNRDGNVKSSGTRNATYSNTDGSGTTVKTASQNLGEPVIQEVRRFDSSGREVPTLESTGAGSDRMIGTGNNRVEDVTESEADREYRERMEDEYAKKEGGA
ncbi:hypothetical protein NA57DRAFT_73506 [Rhizodiscina lignyota]|uniref:Uncharacterized protein n=1 Tax=Rhizodiscina lignyota TaxID=1504668 RepID=A0A9P4M9G0_9PEZI|nr:hypothetical protein NA57DRAFT_73506 [Rhizodiscina lignyota]